MKLRIVLVGVEGEENIGYVARVMDNFNFDNLVLVSPKAKITEITMSRSMRAAHMLKTVETFTDIDSAVKHSEIVVGTTAKLATEKNLLRSSLTPKQLARNLERCAGTVSILLGRESSGLTNEELKKCDLIVTIPTSPKNPALNISNALGIILYELFSPATGGKTPPSRKERKVLHKFFGEAVGSVTMQKMRAKMAASVFRNITERAVISRNESYTLLGAFRKMRNKLKNK